MSNLLNIKDQSGNWIPIPVITNGIKSITQNEDYTLTITLNDGTTYTTTSIKGEDGQDYILTEQDKQEIAGLVDTPVDDVQIDGQSIVSNGVANIPYGSNDNYGLLKASSTNGIFASGGVLSINNASESDIKGGTEELKPLTPNREHMATFYGLAKASGDTTQSQSDNAVGTYTDEAKTAIKSMIGVEDPAVNDVQVNGTSILQDGVANVPIGTATRLGVVSSYIGEGIDITSSGSLRIAKATDAQVIAGTNAWKPIVPANQYIATFYGLAKVAGADEKDSTLPVGTYTDSAKTAIKNMLGVIDGGGTISETITGTDPTISAQNNFRYMCGELYTLNFTPCVSGVCEVIFTSGATPTVLTLPDTVRMPAWWTGVEANTTYEISIVDGVYGAVMSWS